MDCQFFCKLHVVGLNIYVGLLGLPKMGPVLSAVVTLFVVATYPVHFCRAPAWLCDPLLLGFSCWWELLQLCWWLLPSAGCPSCLTPVRPCRWPGGSFPWLAACLRYCNTQAVSVKPQLTTQSYIYKKTFALLACHGRAFRGMFFANNLAYDISGSEWVDNISRQIWEISKSLCRLMLYECDLDIR